MSDCRCNICSYRGFPDCEIRQAEHDLASARAELARVREKTIDEALEIGWEIVGKYSEPGTKAHWALTAIAAMKNGRA